MSQEIYLDVILSQIPRLLGLLDRSIGSPSYGSFDRQYWHYRTVDFSCARSQEAVLTLAILYNLKSENNLYYKNKNILTWINAALEFWCKIQQTNGSFNEWYPKEGSFVATAFSAYAISETMIELKDEPIDGYNGILSSLKKAADWLILRIEDRAVNQTAGATIALYNVYVLTQEQKYLTASRDKIAFLSKLQNEEGWFIEYGGADIGYLSLAIDYLAKYYQKTRDEKVFRILEKAISFIYNFIHPNGTFGGSYTSRNTEYIIPSGFEVMARYLDKSKTLAQAIRISMARNQTIIPVSLDDRYLSYLGYNYLQAFRESGGYPLDFKPTFSNSRISYPNLGIEIINKEDFQFVYNYRKGGTFKIVFRKDRTIEDWGLVLEAYRGKRYFSGWLNLKSTYIQDTPYSFTVNTEFQEVKKILIGSFRFIALRIFQALFGIFDNITGWLKDKLRDMLITRKATTAIILKRSFKVEDKNIIINDTIKGAKKIKKVFLGGKISYILVPSSAYFQFQDLDNEMLIYNNDKSTDTINIIRNYDFEGNLIKVIY